MNRKKLLVLDDQAMYCRSLGRALRGDYDVMIAVTLEQAESYISSLDGALVDIRLDADDQTNRKGLTFVRRLRQLRPDAAIIAMTALIDDDLGVEAKKEGADYFLSKPIELSSLRSLLGKLLGR